ncbi:MAG: glycoside hydrolase family 9 protein, partial [Bacteroidota bacterium]
VQKSTTATLDLAASLAHAARVLAPYEAVLPGLADSCLTAAFAAWDWATAHPNRYYRQETLRNPTIHTGTYGDSNTSDEFEWAALELYYTTAADSFLTQRLITGNGEAASPVWQNVQTLGYLSAATLSAPTATGTEVAERVRGKLLRTARAYRDAFEASPYATPMGRRAGDFHWGGNGHAAAVGAMLLSAHDLTGDPRYLQAALGSMDYLMGRNATGYAWVTGYGSRTPLHIHHRPSEADDVAAPVPGWLAGGPHANNPDGCPDYPSRFPAANYLDDYCSYSTNEMTTYWNAPLLYLGAGLEDALGTPVEAADLPPPLIQSPEPFAEQVSRRTRLVWSMLAPADSFDIEVATDPSFETLVLETSGWTETSLWRTWTTGTTFYWRVRAHHGGQRSRWSPVQVFTTSGAAPTSRDEPADVPDSDVALNAYPNPHAGEAQVVFTLPQRETVHLALYDVMGREVAVLVQTTLPSGPHTQRVSVPGLAAGLYWLRLTTPTQRASLPLVHRP